jgi:hypothetical protein
MSLTLKDLRVRTGSDVSMHGTRFDEHRYATLADLAQVLKAEGAEVLPLRKSSLFGWVLVFGKKSRPDGDIYLVIKVDA